MSRDQEGTRIKGCIQSNVRFDPVSDMKVCNRHARQSIEVQVQFLFQHQTVPWIRVVNDIDKFVGKVMSIQEEEKSFGKSAVKTSSLIKSSSTRDCDFTPIEQRKWIDVETQESKDPHYYHMSNFITRLLRQSQTLIEKKMEESRTTKLLMYVRKCNQTIQDIDQTRWRSTSTMLRIGQLTSGYQFWQKMERWRTEEKDLVLLESELSSEILVLSSNPRPFGKYNQSCVTRQCTVTKSFYRVFLSRRKRKRIEVNSESWFDSRRSLSQNKQTSCVLHCCESDG